PEDVGDAVGVGGEEELARGSKGERLAEEGGDVRRDVGNGKAQIGVDVGIDGGEVALLAYVGIARVKEHEGHAGITLDDGPEVQGIGGEEIEVAVAEAGVELHRQLHERGDLEGAVHEVVVEGLVSQEPPPPAL